MQVLLGENRHNADEPQPTGGSGRWRMRRVEAANPSLTVAAPNLVPEFSATFDTNLMVVTSLNCGLFSDAVQLIGFPFGVAGLVFKELNDGNA